MDTMQIRDRPIGKHTRSAYTLVVAARINGFLTGRSRKSRTCKSAVNRVDRFEACNNAAILHVQIWISVLWRTWRPVYRGIKWNHMRFRLRRTVNLENRRLRPRAILTLQLFLSNINFRYKYKAIELTLHCCAIQLQSEDYIKLLKANFNANHIIFRIKIMGPILFLIMWAKLKKSFN